MNNMDYRKTMTKFMGRLMDKSIFWKLPLIILSGGMCASSYAEERLIDRDEPLFKEIEHSFEGPIKEARLERSESGRLTSIRAFVGPITSYLGLCERINSDVHVPSYPSLLKALGTQTLPSEAVYKGGMENGKIREEGKAYVAVYEGMGNEPKALIILTKSDEKYSVKLEVSLYCLVRGKSLFSQSGQDAKEEELRLSCESFYLGQYDGWRVYICPDGMVNGDYMAGRKAYPGQGRYEVISEILYLYISCEDGTEFPPFIVKDMNYAEWIIQSAAD